MRNLGSPFKVSGLQIGTAVALEHHNIVRLIDVVPQGEQLALAVSSPLLKVLQRAFQEICGIECSGS